MNTRHRSKRRPVQPPKYPCLTCNKDVTRKQQALECDGCNRWLHRSCCRGITLAFYNSCLRRNVEFDWMCPQCVVDGIPRRPRAPLPFSSEETDVVAPPVTKRPRLSTATPMATPLPTAPTVTASTTATPTMTASTTATPTAANTTPVSPMDVDQLLEDSLEDAVVESDDDGGDDDDETKYQVIDSATQRGRPKLTDNRGYTYVWRRTCGEATHWRCSVRNHRTTCAATVIQRNDVFEAGRTAHNHPGQPGEHVVVKVVKTIKEQAAANKFTSAATIVEDVLVNNINADQPIPSLPNVDSLIRTANRVRQTHRPNHPKDLEFELSHEFIPEGFLLRDIVRRNGRRHLIFARDEQLGLLSRAKRLYIDGTFKVVRRPLYQLFSVHCFVKKNGATKQVPLCYALMSGKETGDYTSVLRAIKRAVPNGFAVEEVMLDFESGLWKAVPKVFPNVRCQGCAFHWKNSVWKHIQAIGLQRAYHRKNGSYQLMRDIMALPFLPADSIEEMCDELRARTRARKMHKLLDYIEGTWVRGTWMPDDWSIYMQSVRTNNDAEGWHNRLNSKTNQSNLNMYKLIEWLWKESAIVNLQIRLVSEKKLSKRQRRQHQTRQGRIFRLWGDYRSNTIDVPRLLSGCAKIYGNAPDGQ